nr:MAG TPA: hypothetical protein [Caudoviricetes sp.]
MLFYSLISACLPNPKHLQSFTTFSFFINSSSF